MPLISSTSASRHEEETWLLGLPDLGDFLRFVRRTVVGGAELDRGRLADEWRRANDHYHELEQREVGLADEVEQRDLPPELAPLAEELLSDPSFRRSFDETLPTRLAMVELDKLVVCQRSVTQTFVEELQRQLGPSPGPEQVFRCCLPLGSRDAPVRFERLGAGRYAFRSDSTDFRFHEAVLLSPEQLQGYTPLGAVAGVVGLVVGFGSNLLNAIQVGDRLILHNGYHRACALRGLGLTHAPCVVRTVTRPDELELAAKSSVVDDAQLYLEAARPPLLRDFFDPAIGRRWRVQPQVRVVELTYEAHETYVSA
ncbi:MAG: hypothetical protein AB7N76_25330 [Planctomycetota bacterium]